MKIASLQNLSTFTLLESPTRVKDLLSAAKNKGYEAVALTDINVTYGLVNFYELAKEVGIKALLGMQVRVNGLINSTDKYDLIVLAKNNNGYKNILKLSSAINLLTENDQNNKILTLKELTKYFGDLEIIIPANMHSELLMLCEQNESLGSEYIRDLQKMIPESSSLYFGVYAAKSQQNYINYVETLSKQFNIPLVATEDTQYLEPQDQFLRKTLRAIKNGKKLEDVELLSKQKGSHYLANTQSLITRYHDFYLDKAIDNTWKIAEECNAEVVFQSPVLPKYHQNKFASSQEYLHYLAQTGLQARFSNRDIPLKYQQRLDYELKIINQMGFDNYFLIVWDVINYCHRVGITTGPGRGSACGSLVSYSLRITEVNPLKYNLLFERFLNPSRHEMPDIDLDIPDNRRDDVIKYMYQKYGMDHAAQILTFGTLAAKQALRDVGRVFSLSMVELNKWASAVPVSKTKIDLKSSYNQSREMRLLVDATPLNKLLFQTAKALEGLPRHYSIHAAGLVISDDSIAAISGLQSGPLGIPVTQQTKKYVESLGLLKIDFLGLRNLTILGNTLELIKSQGINIDPNKIPLNDQRTLDLFREGKTDAVFQFESNGIRRVLQKLHPDNFEDLVAVNALYRPGPMQNIDTFIARKKGEEPVRYPDESLRQILQPTYGILVYQEQVMQTAQILAGFSLGEADILRRAMSKKDQHVIDQERNKFISGAIKNGHAKAVAERVYSYIEQFANYGFNRSHAVAYTKIAFWLAYLKVHYPAAFYTALLNSSGASRLKAQSYIMQAQEAGIRILNPDINHSKLDFSLENGKILVGLKAIKGIRVDFLQEIVSLKKPFKSLDDFLRKIDAKYLQLEPIQTLIMAGCFDQINDNRNELLANCKDIIENIQLTGQNLSLSESLGGVPLKEVDPPTNAEKASMEERVLGFATTTTPLVAVQKYAQKFNAKALNSFEVNESGIAVGKLMSLKPIRTKKGATMAFAVFADSGSQQEIIIFPNIYEKIHGLLKEGQIYILGIRAQNDRYDSSKKQYLLTNLKLVNFKE
ncbi:DNA polymerase III subunit alpha [Lactobacillus hamsteri]|uniref:DNA-directed DNA polymerase n=1 Tax=Lactobacillus hamsteri DSM 5661 = JCM 6256 TaxID=1423754 RepID=A0A0R1YBW9_9LACO|nr:DNA polymerase III subunit alpha [Lactobacillus hamsteri]KRM39818.1 DNA-directed DNA polymerase III alpha subunit [Lactobacillus hamsteri DSM 5661 = JCM 6256]